MTILKWIFFIQLLVLKNAHSKMNETEDLSEVRYRIRGMAGDESEVLKPDNDHIFAGPNISESYEGMRYIPKNESFIPDFYDEWDRESSEEPHFRVTIEIPPIPLVHAYLRNQHYLIYQSTTPFNPPTTPFRHTTFTTPGRWNAYKEAEYEYYEEEEETTKALVKEREPP